MCLAQSRCSIIIMPSFPPHAQGISPLLHLPGFKEHHFPLPANTSPSMSQSRPRHHFSFCPEPCFSACRLRAPCRGGREGWWGGGGAWLSCCPSPAMQTSRARNGLEMPRNQAVTGDQTEKQDRLPSRRHGLSPSQHDGSQRARAERGGSRGMLARAEMLGFEDSSHSGRPRESQWCPRPVPVGNFSLRVDTG